MSRVALLDIGSTSVGGVLLESAKNSKKIIFRTRRPVALQNKLDTNRFLNDVAQAAKETAGELSRAGVPGRIICFLSAPFYASRTSLIRKEEPEGFIFSEKLLKSMVEGEIARYREREHEILESSVMDINLNGYQIPGSYGQKTLNVEVGHYLSLASSQILNRLRQAIGSAIHRPDEIEFHSFNFVLFRALDNILPPTHSYLILETGGELSELSLVWRGTLRDTVSFPLGQNWLIRQLSKLLGVSPAEAETTLELYHNKRADQSVGEKLIRIMPKLREEWMNSFREALGQALENSLLPSEIYLVSEAAVAPLFLTWLSDEKFESLVLGSQNFRVKLFDRNLLLPLWGEMPKLNDTPLLVEIIFYDRILAK